MPHRRASEQVSRVSPQKYHALAVEGRHAGELIAAADGI
jgi:hypothetical protein